MISRLYTWRVPIPADRDPAEVLERSQAALARVVTYNANVLADQSSVVYDEIDHSLFVTIHFQGRDQWWIKKSVPYAIGGVLAQSKLSFGDTKLLRLTRPEDSRVTRQRASDGRHNPIPDDQDIDHSDMMETSGRGM